MHYDLVSISCVVPSGSRVIESQTLRKRIMHRRGTPFLHLKHGAFKSELKRTLHLPPQHVMELEFATHRGHEQEFSDFACDCELILKK